MDVAGLKCLVTGGTKGIGKSVVDCLASNNAKVFTCARNETDLTAVIQEWTEKGYSVQGCTCDVTDITQLTAMIDQVKKAFDGRLDVLVNNAGHYWSKPMIDVSRSDYEQLMNMNVRSGMELTQLAFPLLKESGSASIVNIRSLASSTKTRKNQAVHNMAKSAIDALTRSLACEWGDHGIRVNCVAPGIIETPANAAARSNSSFVEALIQETPLKRIGKPEDIARMLNPSPHDVARPYTSLDAVVFFASPSSSFITGQILRVDGGITTSGMPIASHR